MMWVCLCIPRHIHCSCNTVMALSCIPLSQLVSFAFSTIPICPFLIQRIFCLLVLIHIQRPGNEALQIVICTIRKCALEHRIYNIRDVTLSRSYSVFHLVSSLRGLPTMIMGLLRGKTLLACQA